MDPWIFNQPLSLKEHFIFGYPYESIKLFMEQQNHHHSMHSSLVVGPKTSGKTLLLKTLQHQYDGWYVPKGMQTKHTKSLHRLLGLQHKALWADDILHWNQDFLFIFLQNMIDNNTLCLATASYEDYNDMQNNAKKTYSKDIISRLKSWPVLFISPPTHSFTILLLTELFQRIQIQISDELTKKIALYMPNDFKSIINFVQHVDQQSKINHIFIENLIVQTLKSYPL